MKSKRVVVIGDIHAGHVASIANRNWQQHYISGNTPTTKRHNKFVRVQESLSSEYDIICRKFRPVDILFVMGDCIAGIGKLSVVSELITANLEEQAEIATEIILRMNAKKIAMIRGTDFHCTTAEGLDTEDTVARNVDAIKIGDHDQYDVNGLIFDLKHKLGSSTIPHGRATALLKEILWMRQWALRKEIPLADILLRAHVHYYQDVTDRDCRSLSIPALQGMGSKYGSRLCSGTVDWGAVGFDVRSKTDYDFFKHIVQIPCQQSKAKKI